MNKYINNSRNKNISINKYNSFLSHKNNNNLQVKAIEFKI